MASGQLDPMPPLLIARPTPARLRSREGRAGEGHVGARAAVADRVVEPQWGLVDSDGLRRHPAPQPIRDRALGDTEAAESPERWREDRDIVDLLCRLSS